MHFTRTISTLISIKLFRSHPIAMLLVKDSSALSDRSIVGIMIFSTKIGDVLFNDGRVYTAMLAVASFCHIFTRIHLQRIVPHFFLKKFLRNQYL